MLESLTLELEFIIEESIWFISLIFLLSILLFLHILNFLQTNIIVIIIPIAAIIAIIIPAIAPADNPPSDFLCISLYCTISIISISHFNGRYSISLLWN